MLAQLSPWDSNRYLAHTCESAAAALQDLLARELADWRGLALAVRPRVLWVAAHYLELPAMLDETWAVLLGCVEVRGSGFRVQGQSSWYLKSHNMLLLEPLQASLAFSVGVQPQQLTVAFE